MSNRVCGLDSGIKIEDHSTVNLPINKNRYIMHSDVAELYL